MTGVLIPFSFNNDTFSLLTLPCLFVIIIIIFHSTPPTALTSSTSSLRHQNTKIVPLRITYRKVRKIYLSDSWIHLMSCIFILITSCFASPGHDVTCVSVDSDVMHTSVQGEAPSKNKSRGFKIQIVKLQITSVDSVSVVKKKNVFFNQLIHDIQWMSR